MLLIILLSQESKPSRKNERAMSQATKALTATYQSYLVRLWQDAPTGAWRASTECVQTHAVTHFADLDALFVFLGAQAAASQGETFAVREVLSK